jgi:steroid 5-alpha reductase family enzyme
VSGLEFVLVLLGVGVSLSMVMAGAWLVWRHTGNSGWIDTAWTFGLGAICSIGALLPVAAEGSIARRILVALLVAAWSSRLGLHIAQRTAGTGDDPRYAELVRGFGAQAQRGMLHLLQKQALVTVPLALSVLLAAWQPAPDLRAQDLLGSVVLAVAIAGEAIADRQLRRFRSVSANKGRVCDVGLWRCSRHPNYFFEWLGWLAYPVIAIGGDYPWGWLALLAPACMYWLLVHVSGIPPLEAHMLRARGDAFRAYQARTSAFFPRRRARAKGLSS